MNLSTEGASSLPFPLTKNEVTVAPVKYTFDTRFGGDIRDPHEDAIEALHRKVDEARDEGYKNGHETGYASAINGLEARIAENLEAVLAACTELGAQKKQLVETLEAETARIAYSIATRFAPALMDAHPLTEIEALVTECLDGCRREPRVVIRVHESLLDAINDRLELLKLAGGFAGQIVLINDPDLGPHDCRVEWPDGGAERDMNRLEKQIGDAVQRFVAKA